MYSVSFKLPPAPSMAGSIGMYTYTHTHTHGSCFHSIAFAFRDGVAQYGPYLPIARSFSKSDDLRQLLLAKRACCVRVLCGPH